MSKAQPLKERLFSQSPDPVKANILRESGAGWSSPPSVHSRSTSGGGGVISPLRISKRDSPRLDATTARQFPTDIARRSSNSFKHVRSNKLVSQSPFKSKALKTHSPPHPSGVQFPSSPRRVSGEKRPRPQSMQEQAETENERPLALKRERRQSKAYLGLVTKEPVTNSPFRRPGDPLSPPASAVPPLPPSKHPGLTPRETSTEPVDPSLFDPPPKQSLRPSNSLKRNNGPSPIRSSLVSKRLHGPRVSGKRGRRKTVTFHNECDVVEFERDEYGDQVFSDDDESGYETVSDHADDHDDIQDDQRMDVDDAQYADDHLQPPHSEEANTSFDSVNLSENSNSSFNGNSSFNADGETSIADLMDDMLEEAQPDGLGPASTPPRPAHDIPTDLDTEDGVPFGHSHHVQRAQEFHHQEHEQPHPTPPSPPRFTAEVTFGGPPAASSTPPQTPDRSGAHSPPLGRSTHAERVQAAREEEKEEARIEEDVSMLPPSPSPAKAGRRSILYNGESDEEAEQPIAPPQFHSPREHSFTREQEGWFSRFDEDGRPRSRLQDEHDDDRAMDPSNLSIGNSEISLDGLDRELVDNERVRAHLVPSGRVSNIWQAATPQDRPTTPSRPLPRQPEPRRSMVDLATSSPRDSPASFARSPPQVTSPQAPHLDRPASSQSFRPSPSPRPRITREDIQQRIKRQLASPSGSPSGSRQGSPEAQAESSSLVVKDDKDSLVVREDKERDRMSVLTNFSTETSTVETAMKTRVSVGHAFTQEDAVEEEFGMLKPSDDKLKLDFGSKFGLGRLQLGDMDLDVNMDDIPLERPCRPESMLSGSVRSDYEVSIHSSTRAEVAPVDLDVDVRSALDRLMEDVAGGLPEEGDTSMDTEEDGDQHHPRHPPRANPIERAATDTALLGKETAFLSRNTSAASTESVPPPPPPKDKIRTREQQILEKRRERRAELYSEDFTPRHRHLNVHGGRGSRRRSRSTGDVLQDVEPLDVAPTVENDTLLQESIERELMKMDGGNKSKYLIRERETIYASSSNEERVSHMSGPGDVNVGKAWRPVRRPSDMNEYAKQIRELRAQEGKSKAYGKVFVKVVEIKGIHLPLPTEPTKMTCTLNNGIHFVTTPEVVLQQTSVIEQEFELIEHSKLEFTLTLKIKREPHITAQFKALVPPRPVAPPPPPPVVHQTSSKSSGLRSLFGGSSSPKKHKHMSQPAPAPAPIRQPVPRLADNFARYLKPDGTMARAFVSYKEIAPHCDTRLFSTTYPLIGQRFELGGKWSNLQVGEIQLQVFRLPPLPGIPQNQMPQSLDECVRGLRHMHWHKVTYFEGTLTQNGGDCTSWRRRQFRVIGGSLVAFNDVTKRAITTIDIKKAIAVQDDDDARRRALSPTSGSSAAASRYLEEMDGLCGVERSFRLIFPGDEEILFFADSDEEKAKWLQVFRALVGKIPPHPLWAEMLWQRQHEQQKQAAAAAGGSSR
ncbi:hypothetical protein GGF50DRAFT_62111 [Schizophyllum commune]